MSFWELFLTAVGLAMDAFAVSICKGLGMQKLNMKQAVVIALYFGIFQALMPVLGWFLGSTFAEYIEAVDHWIAFGLLLFIGGKMIFDTIREKDEDIEAEDKKLDHKELFLLAIATSIDALAVGIAFACLDVNIVLSVVLIGVVTFVISILGVCIGHKFGAKFKKPASIAGGIILIFIGVKILVEHLLDL